MLEVLFLITENSCKERKCADASCIMEPTAAEQKLRWNFVKKDEKLLRALWFSFVWVPPAPTLSLTQVHFYIG